ncbi:MAG: cbb3-type cytochrome c oxidase subunit I [Deltaproteobacteria bacterium]|nr:cbb3-type cytochrome c oxidase subunit I [Deltaproteobacteria bacterium]
MDKKQIAVVSGPLVRVYVYVALFGILVPLSFALILAAKFVWPDFLGTISWLQFGRIRVFHTNGVIFGWLGLSFFGILNYCVPKLAGRPLLSEKLAWITLYVLVAGVGIGLIAELAGGMQGIEYAEFPWYADIIFAAGFVMASINYLGTLFKSDEKQLYVSSWYFILGFSFTVFNYVMGNVIPAYFAPGAAGAAITGLWIHNAVGLFVTPMGVGIVYFILPVLLGKPVYSHLLSLLGFWTLAFFYPLGGSHHYFFSPIPWWVQVLAVPLTAVLFVVVVTVVYNWFMTLKGSWGEIPKSPALAFMVTGIFAYMATCTQGPFHAFLSVQKVIHFTDWVVAHAHLALFGAFSYWVIGSILYLWPFVTGKPLVSPGRQWTSYWLLTLGFYVFYFAPITASGLLQGYYWITGAPFADSVINSGPFWFARLIGGVLMYVGMVLFARELFVSAKGIAKKAHSGAMGGSA